MNLKLLKTALLAGVLSTNVLASLPDEINFRPYQANYLQLVDSVNHITTDLESLISSREENITEQNRLNQLIYNLEQENVSLNRQIRNNESEITSLLDYNQELEAKIQRLTDRQNRLTKRSRRLNREINQEEQRLKPIRERLARIKTNLANKRSELKVAQREFKAARAATEKKKTQLQKLKQERVTLKTQLDTLKGKLAKIDNDISAVNSSIQALNGQISSAKTSVEQAKAKKQSLQSELDSLKQQLQTARQADRNDPKIPELRSKITAKAQEIKAQTRNIQQAKSKLKSFQNKKQSQKTKFASLQQQKQQLPSKISSKKSQLDSKKQAVVTKKLEVQNAEALQVSKRDNVKAITNEVNAIEGRRTRVAERLQTESQAKVELVKEINDVKIKLANVITKLNSNINERIRTLNRVDQLENEIPRLNSAIRANEFEINRSDRSLDVIADNLQDLAVSINNTRQLQADEILKRDQMFSEYKSREDLYGVKLSDAQGIGVDQSQVADSIGDTDGNQYADHRSNELGNRLGTSLAMKQGTYWAKVRAENQGYLDGYNEGYASSADSARGDEEGILAGMNSARNYANTVLKSQFFEEFFVDLIGSEKLLVKSMSDGAPMIFSPAVEKVNFTINSPVGVEPLSEAEVQNSLEITTPLDYAIEVAQSNLTAIESEISDSVQPQNAYESPEIPFGKVNCSAVYKGVAEFKSACKSAYRESYRNLYLNAHSESFTAVYKSLAESKIESSRNALIESEYNDGYKAGYPVAKNAGLIVGKETIYTERFEAAKVQAYDQELPRATVVAKNKAKYEVQDWINTNATLTLKESKILGTELIGGMQTNLSLSLKNLSPVELKKPVKVIITNLENLETDTTEFFLKQAGGSSTTKFEDIVLRISSDVRSNQKLAVQGKIILSGGKYKAQRVETFSAEAITALNPALSSDLTYTSSPRIVTRFRSRTLIHNLNVDISPSVEQIKAGYDVKLEVMDGSEGLVKLRKTQFNTGSLQEGQVKKLKFSYTFLLAARGKTVKLKLTSSHKGRLVESKIIELSPF